MAYWMQARMSSSRLPGKVMRPVLGEPMIGRQVERLRLWRTLRPERQEVNDGET